MVRPVVGDVSGLRYMLLKDALLSPLNFGHTTMRGEGSGAALVSSLGYFRPQ